MNYSEAIAKLAEEFGPHWTGNNTQAIQRGTSPVEIVKIGRRSYVRTNELRHMAGLPASVASEGGAA